MNTSLPLLYHPTSVLFLDDDPKLLKSLALKLNPALPFVLYKDPESALEHLKKSYFDDNDIAKDLIDQNEDSYSDPENASSHVCNINFAALYGNLASDHRFKKIRLVVVDRHIPKMDGLKFCQLVKEEYKLPVKLILLTGATTLSEATDAFNQGKIDGFVEKSSQPEMFDKLQELIDRLVWQQFEKTSQRLMGILSSQFPQIGQAAFAQAFEQIRKDQGIVEFYLRDSSVSFIMLNKMGHAKILIVRQEEDFKEAYALAQDIGASQSILDSLEKRSHFPFKTTQKNYFLLKDDEWEACMVDMQRIPNSNLFYHIADLPHWDISNFKQFVDALKLPNGI